MWKHHRGFQAEDLVDIIHKGDGVSFFRQLFNENILKPIKFDIINNSKNNVFIVTKIGCHYKCNFCITTKLFNGSFTNAFFSPKIVHDELVKYHNSINEDLYITVCEPQAIIDKKWWYELFKHFNNEPGNYYLNFATSAQSLQNFDLNKIKNSSLKINIIQLGIESFSETYTKNKNVNLIELIKKLKQYKIKTYGSFIIGFDHHTENSIYEEVKQLAELKIDFYSIMNFRPLPQTPLWNKYEKENLILKDIPFDFYYIPGFQSFKHPHFKPGFEDMLPLMLKLDKYLNSKKNLY